MQKMSRMAIGQPRPAAPSADKWALLAALTEAAEDHGLNHRSLGVLRALLSFFPERALPDTPGTAVVFPSNASLSQRLNGMPESTLRRHLATLVRAGIVSRQDSPNRKRFARRRGLAFGFDLSPLARAAAALQQAAEAARARRETLAALRDRLAHVRARLLQAEALPATHPLLETARLTLRRKASVEDLTALLDTLEPHLAQPVPVPATSAAPAPTAEMSASDSDSERHIQSTNKKILSSSPQPSDPPEPVALSELLAHCKEYKSYFPDAVPNWHAVIGIAGQLHQMIGIAPPVYQLALRVLGPERTATVVLCMLEKARQIRNPGGYLRALISRAEVGKLNLRGMVFGCGGAKIVS